MQLILRPILPRNYITKAYTKYLGFRKKWFPIKDLNSALILLTKYLRFLKSAKSFYLQNISKPLVKLKL